MPKNPERDTRGEIIALAADLTQTRGFNWLSYQDLADRLKIRKASIHYHFPNKSDLGVELLRRYQGDFRAWVERAEKRDPAPSALFEAYIEMFRKILGDVDRVCPGGVFGSEWNTLSKEMKVELRTLIADHRAFLERMLKAGRKSGEFGVRCSLEEQIALIGASLQGALQIARALGNAAAFNSVARALRAALLAKGDA